MRKLFLASVTFKVGENQHHEYRLVIADVDKSMTDMEQRELAAEIGFNQWVNEAIRTDRVIYGFTISSVLQKPDEEEVVKESYPVVFTQAYGPDEFPKLQTSPDREGENVSVHVLIDIDGKKEYFDTGWYDFNDKRWINCNDDFTSTIAKNEFKWMYIP